MLEGYADSVLERVGEKLIPSFRQIHEAMQRHRVERGEAEVFIEGLLGLKLERHHYDQGAAFCRGVVERAGPAGLNRLWEAERMLPTPAELDRARSVAGPDRAPRGDDVTDAPVAASHRVIKMASHPDGALEDDDFDLVNERVPEPADGEALVRTLYLSLDPAIRVWMNGIDTYVPGIQVGDVMHAGGLGEVVQSRNAAYTEGDLVFGMMQWSEYCIAHAGPTG